MNEKDERSSDGEDIKNVKCEEMNESTDDDDDEEEEEMAEDEESDDDDDDDEEDDDEEDDDDGDDEKSKSSGRKQAYLPGQPMEADEELICDQSAYVLYERIQTGAPCLSFDILRDDLGDKREDFPMSCYLVAGTQSENLKSNEVIVLKLTDMNRVKAKSKEDDSDNDSSSDEEVETGKSKFKSASIRHEGAVNRIRSTIINQRHMAATWSENKKVYIWDLTPSLCALNNSSAAATACKQEKQSPVFSFSGHRDEGFAMDWNPLESGTLATGDCFRNIHVWQPDEGGNEWNVSSTPLSGHTQSVEDLQWSPTERNWFASCSVDKSIRIWDVRIRPQNACRITISPAHSSDVNVISWNKLEARYIASGGDDGLIKVWDLRQCKPDKPLATLPIVAKFKHHSGPITSIEWSPHDGSVLAVCGEDNQLTQWDIAVEKADVAEDEPDVLPQLLFIHQGQDDMKELHWHPQLPGVIISTALSDFNVFKTISV